jgi:hypothetical protein
MKTLKKNSGISEKKRDALVLIDVINDFDFPGAEALLRGLSDLSDQPYALFCPFFLEFTHFPVEV